MGRYERKKDDEMCGLNFLKLRALPRNEKSGAVLCWIFRGGNYMHPICS
uniref:Uncharacterized protein n=1 Tax=Picea sitchensis TaxID=3332 RepID=A0A6B9XQZ2_PICSI|nr:hypothetical protein Q903MT_gene4032 [Picea sitchensis]